MTKKVAKVRIIFSFSGLLLMLLISFGCSTSEGHDNDAMADAAAKLLFETGSEN